MTIARQTPLTTEGPPPIVDGAPQFAPGALLIGRYRLASVIGRGGMGIVYRADDLKIGQKVALKFLSPQLENDPDKVARLVAEVRLGRRVSHPNVCRLYDIVEMGSHHCIVMELVEGEDLDSLLERIGRLPHDKALSIARDVCSGLAAAHDQGVVHRDLKPGNVMIDSRGRARITDFGLAATLDDLPQRHAIMGTLGYMAPEQTRGGQPTAATDVYALGVLLYEMFTGRLPFQVTSILERSSTPPLPPSTFVPDIDPRVETLIARCLSNEPEDRPPTARAVLQALPLPDVLDAAIAAGETPPPEVVAAAGGIGAVPSGVAWALLATGILCTVVAVLLFGRTPPGRLLRQLPSPETMRSRAVWLADRIAPGRDRDRREWFAYEPRRDAKSWSAASTMRFWYRSSASAPYLESVKFDDPPETDPGAVSIETDGAGRLLRFRYAPRALEQTAVSTGDLFAEAGLDRSRFVPMAIPPAILPPVAADEIQAWRARDATTIVLAGTLGTRPVLFEVRDDAQPIPGSKPWTMPYVLFTVILAFIVVASFVLARRNLNMGRGDARGAWLVALFVASASIASWVLIASIDKLFEGIAYGVLTGVLVGLSYLALEPYVRRRWPRILVSWNRLLQGRFGDPLVARDLLIGLSAAAALRLTIALVRQIAANESPKSLPIYRGVLHMLGMVFDAPSFSVIVGFGILFLLYTLTLLVRKRVIALGVVIAILSTIFLGAGGGPTVIGIIGVVLILYRFGLLAAIATYYGQVLQAAIKMFEAAHWYGPTSLVSLVIFAMLLLWGFTHARESRRGLPRTAL